MAKNVHRTARGRVIDMDALRQANSSTKALGNANMNANGDILDTEGNVIKRREQITQEYYASNPNSVQRVSLKPSTDDYETPEEAVKRLRAKAEDTIPDAPANIAPKGRRKMINPKDDE